MASKIGHLYHLKKSFFGNFFPTIFVLAFQNRSVKDYVCGYVYRNIVYTVLVTNKNLNLNPLITNIFEP